MTINLNDSADFTIDNLRRLIASTDDKTPSQIRVTKDGILHVSKVVGGEDIGDLCFRLETFAAGAGYVGEEAARDDAYINKLYRGIRRNWPEPQSKYIDDWE
jgi:hypothetical protein